MAKKRMNKAAKRAAKRAEKRKTPTTPNYVARAEIAQLMGGMPQARGAGHVDAMGMYYYPEPEEIGPGEVLTAGGMICTPEWAEMANAEIVATYEDAQEEIARRRAEGTA